MPAAAPLPSRPSLQALPTLPDFPPLPPERSGEVFEDFLFTRADGQWLERGAFIGERLAQVPAFGAPASPALPMREDTQVRRYGAVALEHGVRTASQPGDPTARLRFTDVHLWCDTDWRLVSAQDTLLQPGVGDAAVAGTAPACAPWPGTDPAPDDPALLHTLNDHYVRAFREADIAWYDAHLAAEYVVVSSDGALHDRASALARFARPTFATTMKSFPVGNVQVRRFGPVALIHAENAYEMKDGRRGVSRYTDIWHQAGGVGGRWLCIAAHITELAAAKAAATP